MAKSKSMEYSCSPMSFDKKSIPGGEPGTGPFSASKKLSQQASGGYRPKGFTLEEQKNV